MTFASVLDNQQTYLRLDPSGIGRRIGDLPKQCRRAWDEAGAFSLPADYGRVDNVVVAGMGGSAIGGDLLTDLAANQEGWPSVVVHRNFDLPPGVGPHTLVVVSSYSGNTEETLSAFERALSLDTKVTAVTTGGELGRRCEERGVPWFTVPFDGEPRSAIGYSLFVPLALLSGLGLANGEALQTEKAFEEMELNVSVCAPTLPITQNFAKSLACEMHGKLIVVYGAGILRGVAYRWKTQLNENAKTLAFSEQLPELDHNSIVGYDHPPLVARDTFVILLRPSDIHPRIAMRYDLTAEILQMKSIPHRIIDAQGSGALAQMVSTVCLGDYVSYYLGLINELDPALISTIDYLKGRLSNASPLSRRGKKG
jgi:glucose/mannose-6-phosphate isomerase